MDMKHNEYVSYSIRIFASAKVAGDGAAAFGCAAAR